MTNLVFFGHHKCASTWMGRIFYDLQAITGWSIQYGFNPSRKLNILGNAKLEHVRGYENFRGLHLIRDPRDIVISGYYSHLKTHPTRKWPELEKFRKKLLEVDMEKGLLMEMDFLANHFHDMQNWDYNNPNILELRFEQTTVQADWLKIFDFLGIVDHSNSNISFQAIMTYNKLNNRKLVPFRFNEVKVPEKLLLGIPEDHSFKKLSGGRKKGETNINSHYRKGLSGEWKTVFTEYHKDYFKQRFPGLLEKLQYESTEEW